MKWTSVSARGFAYNARIIRHHCGTPDNRINAKLFCRAETKAREVMRQPGTMASATANFFCYSPKQPNTTQMKWQITFSLNWTQKFAFMLASQNASQHLPLWWWLLVVVKYRIYIFREPQTRNILWLGLVCTLLSHHMLRLMSNVIKDINRFKLIQRGDEQREWHQLARWQVPKSIDPGCTSRIENHTSGMPEWRLFANQTKWPCGLFRLSKPVKGQARLCKSKHARIGVACCFENSFLLIVRFKCVKTSTRIELACLSNWSASA